MNKYLVCSLLIFFSLQTSAQEVVYDKNAEVRNVGAFSAIEVSGSITVYVMQSNENALAVSADEEKYNEKIITEVKNGTLKISVDGGLWNTYSLGNRKLHAYISVIDLSKVSFTGASILVIKGTLKGSDLLVAMSGASEIKGDIQVGKLAIEASGASVIKITGSAKQGIIEASGANKTSCYKLNVDEVVIHASGAASIRIGVSKSIEADASGGATIYYSGSPSMVKTNASGGATIKSGKSPVD